MEATYISTVETARFVRVALKKHFPKTKFSVRSDKYSMGASVNVDWFDGPSGKMVKAVVDPFTGRGFDSSIDMKYYWSSWLNPDGTVDIAVCKGTIGSKGCVTPTENPKPHPDSKLVRFAVDDVALHRSMSYDLTQRALASAERRFGKLNLQIKLNSDGSAYLSGDMNDEIRAREVTSKFMSV